MWMLLEPVMGPVHSHGLPCSPPIYGQHHSTYCLLMRTISLKPWATRHDSSAVKRTPSMKDAHFVVIRCRDMENQLVIVKRFIRPSSRQDHERHILEV